MPRARTKPTSGWMSAKDLSYEAKVRLDHACEWVAWNSDMTRAVAFGPDRQTVRTQAIQAGVSQPVMEWVPPVMVRPVGDAG
jgi:hypothetical protein